MLVSPEIELKFSIQITEGILRTRFRILDYFAKRSRASLLQFLYHVIIRDNQRRKTFTSESN
jgi:hypothetical protein